MDTMEPETKELSKGEQQRRTKEKAIAAAKIKKYIPWGLFLVIIIGGLYWLTVSTQERNEHRPGESHAIEGRDHIAPGADHDEYETNPPTSGAHGTSLPWGFSETEVLDENAVHNLEHGGIWITYKDLDEFSINKLKIIAELNAASVLISPRAANDHPVSVASWGRLLDMQSVDLDAINEFIKVNKNQSPERLAR